MAEMLDGLRRTGKLAGTARDRSLLAACRGVAHDGGAQRMVTVSPRRTSLRTISSALWRVALVTTTPPTVTGSSLATGVRAPVRPTWISIARTIVVASSAGNLWASAQRGLRDTNPNRSCQS